MQENLGFIDPTFSANGKLNIPMAPRPANLAGKMIGMIDNTKEQGALILQTIGDVLVKEHGAAGVIVRRKEHYSKQAPDEMINELAQKTQIAVSALGG